MRELVADEPQVIDGLEVVARGGLAVTGRAAGEEVRPRVAERGPGGRYRREGVEREGEADEACAAKSSSSTSGTSAAS